MAQKDDALTGYEPFVPVLTVMVDYGNAPFLWLVDAPDQAGVGNFVCDGAGWDETLPMPEALWQEFADWAIDFDRTSFFSDDFDCNAWDWAAFHARGLQLASRLKTEVGDSYRVVYQKPCEDPNSESDHRRALEADDTIVATPSFRGLR